jgi:hypothetical protein
MSPESPAAREPSSGTTERPSASIRYLDRADMVETFADSITGLMFDGQTLRIEFGVTRFDASSPIRRSPAAAIPPVASYYRRRPPST